MKEYTAANKEELEKISLWNGSIFFAASKTRAYREAILLKTEVIVEFFTNEGLVTEDLKS